EKNPEDRYRSARALSRELRHWLEEHAQEGADPADEVPAARKRPLVWGLSAVAALFVAGAAWWALAPHQAGPDLAQAPPPAVLAPAPAPVVVVAVAPPVVDTAGSAPLAQASAPVMVAPPVPAPVAVAPPAVETPRVAQAPAAVKPAAPKETVKERRAREREARLAATSAGTAAVATGVLRLAVSPWGQVEVDGKSVGIAPPLNELTLSEGRHTITIRNDEFPPYSASVNIVPGQPASLKHRFGS
ncbi:MAG: PEGA domain-containing protein, partial [Cytophagales bacterium]|nr:PEGA domain-containing protein [Rhizobacter sp.]